MSDVAVGDAIYFVLDPGTDTNCDTTFVDVTLSHLVLPDTALPDTAVQAP